MATDWKPKGYHTMTPYLAVEDAAGALAFYTKALGATEKMRLPMGDRIAHAEMTLGDCTFMLSDEFPEMGSVGPKKRGGTSTTFMVYVEDVDAAVDRAVKAGATLKRPVENQFWGDRTGNLVDPYGHEWMLATKVEDVSEEEMNRRMAAMPPM